MGIFQWAQECSSCHGVFRGTKHLVENLAPFLDIYESLKGMKEAECARCGWRWIMYEGETEADCPFCPKKPGRFVFVTGT